MPFKRVIHAIVISSGIPAVRSLMGLTTPHSRKISMVRACTPLAFGNLENPLRRSSTRHLTPARPRASAALKPAGPAPMISTSGSSLISTSPSPDVGAPDGGSTRQSCAARAILRYAGLLTGEFLDDRGEVLHHGFAD